MSKWSLEQIKDGLEKYKGIYGRYPSTLDFDKVDYLPTSRYIQRNLGGVVRLRKLLKLDCEADYTKGSLRSSVAKESYKRAGIYEEYFYKYLISKVDEIRVHEHKIMRPGNICCDFFIYNIKGDSGIVVDLFYAQDMYSLARIVNIKLKRYKYLQKEVFFVNIGNFKIEQPEIDKLILNKKISLPKNIKVLNESSFKTFFEKSI